MATKNTQEDIIKVENGRLIVDVDATGTNRSKDGKGDNIVLFSTHGNVKLPSGASIGINLYTKA